MSSQQSSNKSGTAKLSKNKTQKIEKGILRKMVSNRDVYLAKEIKKYNNIKVIYD